MKLKPYIAAIVFFDIITSRNVLAEEAAHMHEHSGQFGFESIVEPLGIATLFCVIVTLVMGLLLKKYRKIILPWHRRLAFLTLILGLLHGALALIFF